MKISVFFNHSWKWLFVQQLTDSASKAKVEKLEEELAEAKQMSEKLSAKVSNF